jgi:hypothetical protein
MIFMHTRRIFVSWQVRDVIFPLKIMLDQVVGDELLSTPLTREQLKV